MKSEKCTANSKQTGKRCGNRPAKGFKVCRFHGARGGAKTAEGKLKQKTSNITSGLYTKEALEERRAFREVLRDYRAAIRGS